MVSVNERKSYPLLVKQTISSEAAKAAIKWSEKAEDNRKTTAEARRTSNSSSFEPAQTAQREGISDGGFKRQIVAGKPGQVFRDK